ncbi:MAG: hypothetical protein GX677_08540 [Treponema sp.]|nr:hypothetical protein [Treponema sp.]
MKKTLIVLLSVVAGLFFSCSNSSDTSTLMTLAVIQQQQAAEAAAVKVPSLSVGDVYLNSMTSQYFEVKDSTTINIYSYTNNSLSAPSAHSYNADTGIISYSGNVLCKLIQNDGKLYSGTFIAKTNANTSFCTTWAITSDSNTLSYTFNTDKTCIYSLTGSPDTTLKYEVSPYNSNLYTLSYNGIEMKVYYDASSGITTFMDQMKLTKVSGLPA